MKIPVTVTRAFLAPALIAGLFSTAHTADAAVIFTEDFETSTAAGSSGSFTSQWPSTDFTTTGNGNELNKSFADNSLHSTIGEAFGSLYNTTLMQADPTGLTYADNTVYTFTFDHFKRDDTDGESITVRLLTTTGALVVDGTFAAVTTDTVIEPRSISFTTPFSGGTMVGEGIRIEFQDPSGGGAGSQAALDNFVLDATVVPEPSASGVVALGLLGLALRRRR